MPRKGRSNEESLAKAEARLRTRTNPSLSASQLIQPALGCERPRPPASRGERLEASGLYDLSRERLVLTQHPRAAEM